MKVGELLTLIPEHCRLLFIRRSAYVQVAKWENVWIESRLRNGQDIHYGASPGVWRDARIDDDVRDCWVMSDYCSFGDYDNSTQVERSNYKVVSDSTPNVRKVDGYGSHGTTFLLIALVSYARNVDGIRDTFEGLEDYCLIDESAHSECEMEAESEAWDSWVRSDFRAELIKAELWDEDREDENALYALFRAACEKANENAVHESGGNVHWNIERIVGKIDAAFIERLEKHNPDQLQLGGVG